MIQYINFTNFLALHLYHFNLFPIFSFQQQVKYSKNFSLKKMVVLALCHFIKAIFKSVLLFVLLQIKNRNRIFAYRMKYNWQIVFTT